MRPEIEAEFAPAPAKDYEPAMDQYFTFLGVVYWNPAPQLMPGLYRSPVASNALAYAEVRVFVPASRIVWLLSVSSPPTPTIPMGGAPGYQWPSDPSTTPPTGSMLFRPGRQPGVNTETNLWNQHWTCQLVPATHPMAATILQTPPTIAINGPSPLTLPNLAGVSADDLNQINYH